MSRGKFWSQQQIVKQKISILQINLGDRCNQACTHCHVAASPAGNKNMHRKTAEKIIDKIAASSIRYIEFTGGAPELNPNLQWFIEALSSLNKTIAVRSNLTVLDMPEHGFYFELYRKYRIRIIASLPCYLQENVDRQRGAGVYTRSIAVLKKLNALGYGSNGLTLDLVYNPLEDLLPPDQKLLQQDYAQYLSEHHGITFNALVPITNAPVGRFRKLLREKKKLGSYIRLLKKNFNPTTISQIMCRALLSINYQGYVYDCDFNQALDRRIKSYERRKFWEIDFSRFSPEITFAEHCYACTAGSGSSCHGTLVDKQAARANRL